MKEYVPDGLSTAQTAAGLAHMVCGDVRFVGWLETARPGRRISRKDLMGGIGGLYFVLAEAAALMEEGVHASGTYNAVDFYATLGAVANAILTDTDLRTIADILPLVQSV